MYLYFEKKKKKKRERELYAQNTFGPLVYNRNEQ